VIKKVHISGYRSIRELSFELQPINVLTGPNGCGKSNLYNSLVLIGRAAQGQLAQALAEEGGTPSVFWAGGERVRYQRKKPPKRVILGFDAEEYAYELQIGLPSLNEHALATIRARSSRKGGIHLASRGAASDRNAQARRPFSLAARPRGSHGDVSL
jgi:predicted ATPase